MSTTHYLPTWARDILSAVPHRGEGLNLWLMRASLALPRIGRSEREAIEELRCLTDGEPLTRGEIERAVINSAKYMTDNGIARPARKKWPAVNESLRSEIVSKHFSGSVELWERSPVRFTDDRSHTEEIIDTLFPGNPLICPADGPETAVTAPRESFGGRLGRRGLIVPSAMTKLTGTNQDGEVSKRCLDNTGPRQHLVVEQDAHTMDEQAAIIMHLADRAPLITVVFSGSKSLHAWFACAGQDESRVLTFFRYAVSSGADPATWTRCQLLRMPDGTRLKDGKKVRQAVLYWNPGITGATA